MNKVIEEQLNKCRDADLSHFDKETNTYFIPRKTSISIKENEAYIIEIEDTMLVSNIISNNWNQGSIPPFNCCKAVVLEYNKNMIKVEGIEYNKETQTDGLKVWSGWLPLSEINIISKI